jgi:RNase P/RNase MRP subunit POP5
MGIYLVRFDGQKGIIRCNHFEKENTILLLKTINKILSNKIKIKTLGTSGTIKALLKKHM